MQEALSQKTTATDILGKGLGILWLIDGLLQLQPKMFGADFINNVLAPNLTGQPGFMRVLVAFGIRVFTLNTVFANWIAALLQVAIGVLLLIPGGSKKFKIGLYLSIIWGLIVWVFGEGLGGLLAGSAGLYSGLPGSALIYVLISIFLLVPEKINNNILAATAAIILLIGAALQLQPMFWAMPMTFLMSAADPARAISALPNVLSGLISAHSIAGNWVQVVIPLLLSLALFFKPNKITLWITLLFLFLVWWLGQDFGNLSTVWVGTATDLNTAPLIALLILPLLLNSASAGY